MTNNDAIVYNAIVKFIKENGYPPSVRELCKITGKSSTGTIQYRINSLKKKDKVSVLGTDGAVALFVSKKPTTLVICKSKFVF